MPLYNHQITGLNLAHIIVCVLFSGLIVFPDVSFASVSRSTSEDHLLQGARLCTRYLPQQERRHGIPAHLLTAIAATESGRYNSKLKMALPWPWTVNAAGKGYYFDSKREAIAAVKRFQRQGIKSIDVGCMQVNLYHHSKAFSSLSQAFEPRYNVAYAARFLRENYEKDRSWRKASGSYHSRTAERSRKYSGKVFKTWRKILALVSRSGRANQAAVKNSDTKRKSYTNRRSLNNKNNNKVASNKNGKVVEYAQAKPGMMLKYLGSKGVKVIDVKKANSGMGVTKQRGVKVVRPKGQQSGDNNGNENTPLTETQKNTAHMYQYEAANKIKGQFNPGAKYVKLGNVTTRALPNDKKSLFVFK